MNSFFFLQADKNDSNHNLLDALEQWSSATQTQTYVIDRPLGDNKYSYSHKGAIVVLVPKRKITFIDFSDDAGSFESFVEDFIEDLGSISDKYRYKEAIGRPRKWKDELLVTLADGRSLNVETTMATNALADPAKERITELIISLLTGSINDIERVRVDIPESRLDKVKRKIQLFDGDQTRFVYQRLGKPQVRIQGLSGTGKTELLLHKLKELYVDRPDTKIALTCHNKILADSLRRRIPDFFNFMKVEQQIKWGERLWCTHAWGYSNNENSGVYRYICGKYQLPFQRWSVTTSFDKACSDALAELKKMPEFPPAFDYVLIDESQDFPESFFDLCQAVTKDVVYIAGDFFQSIFDESVTSSISPDFLLSKCYRTDPKTLMFAHAVGMGLFESEKLRWLEDKEWENCGYLVDKDPVTDQYKLKREPLRRFEDLDNEQTPSVEIVPTVGDFSNRAVNSIVELVKRIAAENPTVSAEDIGIIFLDNNKQTYAMADKLQQVIPRSTGWNVNKAYETKQKVPNELFVSNRNNVKGLEFPFVICITEYIGRSYTYRNALYMTLTRSFLQSFVIVSSERNVEVLEALQQGLAVINGEGIIKAMPPTAAEKDHIRTAIKYSNSNMSFFDFTHMIFDEINVLPLFRPNLLDALKKVVGEDFDHDNVKETAEFLYLKMQRGSE
ncbi:MAG: AAA family ATPase [Thiobacillus sp.]|nr:AAA family ATPase [Thiobacillus sp.]